MSEEENEILEQERMQEQLDCVRVVYEYGLEGTAERIAAHFGLSRQWQQLKPNAQPRTAAVG